MDVQLCQACGANIDAEGDVCPRCGWVARPHEPAPADDQELWPDDEDLAARLELATRGEYEIEGLIGRGGMATVFLAREVALDRPVAIKVMAPHIMRSYGMAERFKREARVAAGLSHPNIIPIHAVRESGSLVCLVMKRLSGRSLDAILRDHHPLPLPIAQVVFRDVAAALDFAHQHGVIHRDVKPANILVDQTGDVVVTDFGIAKAREADALTLSGTAIGTPAYMSPEQAMGKRASGASDQYSLGAVAYELLSGRMPFFAETAMGLMYQHTHTPPDPLRTIRPDLPEWVAAAVERMLAKRPEDRFPTLAEACHELGIPESVGTLDDPVRKELARLAGPTPAPRRRSGGSATGSSGTTRARPSSDPNVTTFPMIDTAQRRRRRGLLVAISGVVLVALTVLGVYSKARIALAPAPADSSSRAAVAAPQPKVDPPLGRVPAPRPVTPQTVEAAIERYRRAVESRSLAELLTAYPAMEPDQVESYREFFRTADQVRFEVVVKDLEQKDGEAQMKLEGFLRFRVRKTGIPKIQTYGTRARLVDGPTGWRIMEIR